MGNDVHDMISRHKGKYIVSSIWIYKNKCTKKGSWFSSERIDYDMAYSIDQYISSIETTCIEWRRNIILHFRGSDYRRYMSSTRYDMMESFLMVKWVPTFKVECRRLGYVDDLKRRTHGRCYDERILEWCLGYNTQTRKQECGIFQMDL